MPDGGGRTVLVIEDDEALRRMAVTFLRAAGYTPREAPDGFVGLTMARDAQVDLVLLDLMMPGLDGWEVLRQLKSQATTAAIPVIVLTASVGATLNDRALRMGAAHYLVKPLDARLLIGTVGRVLAGRTEPVSSGRAEPLLAGNETNDERPR